MASGLAAAHNQGLIHRDIKPSNILLESGIERLQITDFGLARAADDASLTQSGVIAGTPQYMSPEQSRGEAIDHRSDLFSLGSVLYAVCTGHPPFRAETPFGVLQRICDEQPRPIVESNAELPAWLGDIIGWLHEKDATKRIETAREAAELFQQCLAHVQQPDVIDLPRSVSTRSKKNVPVALAVLLLAVSGLIGWVATFGLPADAVSEISPSDSPIERQVTAEPKESKLPEVIDPAADPPSVVAVIPPTVVTGDTPTHSVSYQFPDDADVAYSVRLTADLENTERTIEGIIAYRAEAIDGEQLTLLCRSDLSQSERLLNPMSMPMNPWRSLSGWATSTGQLQLKIRIGRQGRLLQNSARNDLPFALGDLPQLLLPELPAAGKQTWQGQQHVRMETEAVTESSFGRSGFGPPIPSFLSMRGMSSIQQLSAIVNVERSVLKVIQQTVRVSETVSTTSGQPLNVRGAGTVLFDRATGHVITYKQSPHGGGTRPEIKADDCGGAVCSPDFRRTEHMGTGNKGQTGCTKT